MGFSVGNRILNIGERVGFGVRNRYARYSDAEHKCSNIQFRLELIDLHSQLLLHIMITHKVMLCIILD